MIATFTERVGSTKRRKAELTPTTHPKGGDAWTVQIDGVDVGILRRWERDEVSMTITPTRGAFTKTRKTYWSIYAPVGAIGRVYESRATALRAMAETC